MYTENKGKMQELYKAFYSVKEFALKLNVHPNTIRNSIRTGRINAFKVGCGVKSNYRIPASEIQRMALIDFKKINNLIMPNEEPNQI